MDSHLAMITPAGSKLPAYGFETTPLVFPGPFGFRLIPLCCFSAPGKIPVENPLPVPPPEPGTGIANRRSPSGLSPLWLVARVQLPATGAYLAVRPDLLSLPTGAAILFTFASGSSFQVRYRPRGSLSVEPLGTITMMYPRAFCVNEKVT
jgi:hypothetical protein